MIALFHWWWDPNGLARAQVATGVLGSCLAIVAIVYAWVVAKRQLCVMDEQTAISKRQMELAEKQDTILEVERAKTALVKLVGEQEDHGNWYPCIFYKVVNRGDRSIKGFYWMVVVDEAIEQHVKFYDMNETEVGADWMSEEIPAKGKRYLFVQGHSDRQLFPGDKESVIEMRVSEEPPPELLSVMWRTKWEDDRFPQAGFATLTFVLGDNIFYKSRPDAR